MYLTICNVALAINVLQFYLVTARAYVFSAVPMPIFSVVLGCSGSSQPVVL